MITFTPAAGERLRALRQAEPETSVLRVFVTGEGCCGVRYGLAFDEASAPTDTVFKADGIPVAVDAASRAAVEGSTIDFVDVLTGGGFVVRNERQSGGCGCGRR